MHAQATEAHLQYSAAPPHFSTHPRKAGEFLPPSCSSFRSVIIF